MKYNKYFEQLSKRIKSKIELFPNKKVSYQKRDADYYINFCAINGFKYNFVISTKRSKVYGKDFVGFIIELLIDGNDVKMYFNQLKKYKTEIEQELNSISLNWQDIQNSNRCRDSDINGKRLSGFIICFNLVTRQPGSRLG